MFRFCFHLTLSLWFYCFNEIVLFELAELVGAVAVMSAVEASPAMTEESAFESKPPDLVTSASKPDPLVRKLAVK